MSPDPFRELLLTLPDEIAAAREAGLPVELEVDAPLAPHAQRLMDTLGVEVRVVSALRDDTRERHPDGTLTAAEMDRRHQVFLDAQPMRTECAVDGCAWAYEGTTGECREQAFAHRRDTHGITAAGKLSKKAERALGEAGAAGRREIHARAGHRPAENGSTKTWSRKARTREEVIEAIQRFAREHGRPPTREDFVGRTDEYVSAASAARLFGSWSDAVVAAGLPRPTGIRQDAWTRERAIEELQRVAADLGRVPTTPEVKSFDLPGQNAYCRLFGSWSSYVEAAGFQKPTRGRRLSADREAANSRGPAVPPSAVPARERPVTSAQAISSTEPIEAAASLSLDLITGGDTEEWIAKLAAEADRLERRALACRTIVEGLTQLQETDV